jgi:hypothetical protein
VLDSSQQPARGGTLAEAVRRGQQANACPALSSIVKPVILSLPGKGRFTLLRLYSPTEGWHDKTWRPGEIELVK